MNPPPPGPAALSLPAAPGRRSMRSLRRTDRPSRVHASSSRGQPSRAGLRCPSLMPVVGQMYEVCCADLLLSCSWRQGSPRWRRQELSRCARGASLGAGRGAASLVRSPPPRPRPDQPVDRDRRCAGRSDRSGAVPGCGRGFREAVRQVSCQDLIAPVGLGLRLQCMRGAGHACRHARHLRYRL